MFQQLVRQLRELVALAQERNTLALQSLSELLSIHKVLKQIEAEQDQQTTLLTTIAAELAPPKATVATHVIFTVGPAVPQ